MPYGYADSESGAIRYPTLSSLLSTAPQPGMRATALDAPGSMLFADDGGVWSGNPGRFASDTDANYLAYLAAIAAGTVYPAPSILIGATAATAVAMEWGGDGYEVSGDRSQGASRKYPSFFSLGDSISCDGGYLWNAASAPSANVYRYSWQWYAQAASKSKMRFAGAFGYAGKTIEEIVDGYLPYLIANAQSGDYVFVLMGQNNLGGYTATAMPKYRSAIDSMMSVGLIPILCTLTPAATSAWYLQLNSFILDLAREKKLHACDMRKAVINPADGTWINALRRDGVDIHPNELGAWTLGQEAASVITAIVAGKSWETWLPYCEADYTTLRAGGGSIASQLFLTDNGATPPLPTGWFAPSAPTAGATSFSTVSGIPGRVFRLTKVAGNNPILRTSFCRNGTIAGDRYILSMRITSVIAATGTKWGFGVMNAVGSAYYDRGRNNNHHIEVDQTDDIIVVEFIAGTSPEGLFDITISGGDGGYVEISQLNLLNLTALGL